MQPRTAISVSYNAQYDGIMLGFDGHSEIISLADAEALGERILDWVEHLRWQIAFGGKTAD